MNYLAESKPIYEITQKIRKASDVAYELRDMEKLTKEHFVALYMDGANRVIHKETISIGILNSCQVHPREVFAPAVEKRAASLIVAHNHPSGKCEASDEDIEVTKRLKKAGEILGIELLDHIIIVDSGFLSLRDEDLL